MELLIGPFMSLIGSIIGVIGAYFIAVYQIKKENEMRANEKESIVVIGAKKIEKLIFFPKLKIEKLEELDILSEKINNLSTLSVPVINGGKTPIYNISIKYKLNNIDQFKEFTNYNDSNLSLKFDFYDDQYWLEIKIPQADKQFTLKQIAIPDTQPTDSTSVIVSGQSSEFYLPEWYILLVQYHLMKMLREQESNYKNMFLKATVSYDDYKLNRKESIFYIYPSGFSLNIDEKSNAEISINMNASKDEQL